MTSTLRPFTPPCALMSSAAIAAALVSEAPATEDSSPMTPILIGSVVCAEAPSGESTIKRTAHPSNQGRIPLVVLGMVFLSVAFSSAAAGIQVRPLGQFRRFVSSGYRNE